MGPNITLTAFEGLVIFGPFFALVAILFVGFTINHINENKG
jgi:hypothetical protein